MGILNIRPVTRGESKAVVGVAGPSGTGKTYTALKIARGMVDNPSEIGFLDTENKRGSLYAEILDGPFMIADLVPPFSPQRFSEAIKEFQAAGVKVLVIDSASHEWEGPGSAEEIADKKIGNSNMPNWAGAKKAHKGFMNTLLHCNMHIIACLRAREKTDFKDPSKPVSLGVQPICEKNFMFELTASIMMSNEGKSQDFLKMPYFLRDAFGTGKDYIGEETGRKIIEALSKGDREDPEITRLKSEMMMACEFGLAGVMAIWNTLDKKQKKILEDHKNMCKESALEYERQEQESGETPQDTLRRQQAEKGQTKIDLP